MSYITQFASGSRTTKQIVNDKSLAGFFWQGVQAHQPRSKSATSGAMTANTLKTVVSVSGSAGIMDYFAVKTADTTSRTLRVKVTVDGFVVFDFTSSATTTASDLTSIISSFTDHSGIGLEAGGIRLTWNNTLLIEAASSVTETDKFTYYYRYNLEQ